MDKIAVVTGVTGQDGTFLAKQLLAEGHKVIGLRRRTSTDNLQRLRRFNLLDSPKLILREADVSDYFSVSRILDEFKPDEIYNTAAQSHVATSFEQPQYTHKVNYDGVINVLEWLRLNKSTKLYQCGTSEEFGDSISVVNEYSKRIEMKVKDFKKTDWANPHWKIFQDEQTPFSPQSPYAVSKCAAHQMCNLYRDCYNLQVWTGIFFNHTSEVRGENFVERKITRWLGQFIKWLGDTSYLKIRFDNDFIYKPKGTLPKLRLGNIDSSRDFGYAGEYTQVMQQMLIKAPPDTYVVATGNTISVRDFLTKCFLFLKIPENVWEQLYVIDQSLFRPAEVPYLRGNSIKIQKTIGWTPTYTIDDIVRIMILEDSK